MSNNSVIELAQLLTGALDENFNIRNQSAVVKVVTCLEAFKITHESYREVQNTRIIKDLQALRQNKANDQVLAKRIKNLLRKWKERLASSVPVQSNSLSQPNSPQNFSQGSCDTQFTTQQSQSPPNSLPPSSSASSSSRIVNGPTSFKNLLPKSHNQPNFQPSITPPARIISPQIPPHQQHIYQNGGLESNSNSGPPSLGKRKIPPENNFVAGGIGPASADIDENSNHNRRKMMKKSNSGAMASPLAFSTNNFSNSTINNHNNNSNSSSNQLISKSVPVPPPQSHQNYHPPPPIPPATVLPSLNQPIQQEAPQPKKRGRRKGSKGIDSQLNGSFIPDFQAEIQQKIALSAGKRNKTTFELQQMLEAHQNSSTSWTNGDVIDSSSCDRVNYNASSTRNPPDSNYSTLDEAPVRIKKEVTAIKLEPISEEPSTSAVTMRPQTIEDEIAKLNALLPPIDYEAAANAKFKEYTTYDKRGNQVTCTCTFREVITYADELEESEKKEDSATRTTALSNGFDEPKVNINSSLNGDSKPGDSDDDDDDETDDFCAVEDVGKERSPSPPLMRSAVKSIFDPEYDANENLIEEMVRQKPRNTLPKIIEVKIEKDAVKSSRMESLMTEAVVEQQPIPQSERVPIITYVCDEDPDCPARHFFERDPVCRQDVERLHSSFVSCVNGNWNGVLEDSPEHDFSPDNENIDYARDRLWKRVVPRYNFLTLDKVPKTFDDNSPFSIPPPPPPPPKKEREEDCKEQDAEKKSSSNDTLVFGNGDSFSLQKHRDMEFREWHEVMNVRSYNDEILTILPYVVID